MRGAHRIVGTDDHGGLLRLANDGGGVRRSECEK